MNLLLAIGQNYANRTNCAAGSAPFDRIRWYKKKRHILVQKLSLEP